MSVGRFNRFTKHYLRYDAYFVGRRGNREAEVEIQGRGGGGGSPALAPAATTPYPAAAKRGGGCNGTPPLAPQPIHTANGADGQALANALHEKDFIKGTPDKLFSMGAGDEGVGGSAAPLPPGPGGSLAPGGRGRSPAAVRRGGRPSPGSSQREAPAAAEDRTGPGSGHREKPARRMPEA